VKAVGGGGTGYSYIRGPTFFSEQGPTLGVNPALVRRSIVPEVCIYLAARWSFEHQSKHVVELVVVEQMIDAVDVRNSFQQTQLQRHSSTVAL